MIRVHTLCCYCVSKMLSPLPGRGQDIIIIVWHAFLLCVDHGPLWALPCGCSGIVCTCAITTIKMTVLSAIVVNDGIIKFFLSLLASRSKFRSAENGSLRLLEVAWCHSCLFCSLLRRRSEGHFWQLGIQGCAEIGQSLPVPAGRRSSHCQVFSCH